jgi:hypothetical protein
MNLYPNYNRLFIFTYSLINCAASIAFYAQCMTAVRKDHLGAYHLANSALIIPFYLIAARLPPMLYPPPIQHKGHIIF